VEYPTRTCIACRRPAAKPTLLRLAAIDGTVQVDPLAHMPGRGAYVCSRQECMEAALRRDGMAIARGLRLARGAVDVVALRRSITAAMSGEAPPSSTEN
jgi:uncharacterized protein